MPRKRALNAVGERVKIARGRRNPPLTQDELSGRLAAYGVPLDRAAISRIKRGSRYVPDFEVRASSKLLGVSPAWLLGMEA